MSTMNASIEINKIALKAKNGDNQALSELWQLCEPYAKSICSKYAPHSCNSNRITEYDDLYQCSYLAFRKALDKWQLIKSASFSTYYTLWAKEYCRQELGISNTKRKEPLNYACSLDTTVGGEDEDSETHSAFLVDEAAANDFEQIEIDDLVQIVREEISKLSERHKEVIKLYYYEKLLLKEIAVVYGVSMTTSQRYLDKAHRELKKSERLQLLYQEIRCSEIDKSQTAGLRAFRLHNLSSPEAHLIFKEKFNEDMARIFLTG